MQQLSHQPNQIFQKKCPIHNDNLKIILIQKQVDDNLICQYCVQENEIHHSQYVNFKKIAKMTDQCTITHFPPLEDQEIQKFLNKFNQKNEMSELTEKINNYFDQMKVKLVATIDQIQNETKQKISILESSRKEIMDAYDDISSKQELKNLIISNEDENNLTSKLKKIIEDKFNNISTNTSKIKEKVDKYIMQRDNICFDFPQKIQKFIEAMIKNIDFFNKKDLFIIINEYTQINNINSNQQPQNSNINTLIELVKNPTNYCSQEYLSQLENLLHKVQFTFNEINLQNNKYNKEKQMIFSNFLQKQLENIRVLCQKIQNSDQEELMSDEISQEIQINTNIFYNQILNFNLSEQQQLNRLLKKYPIFDLINLTEKNNKVNSINFIKANASNSQSQQITKINNGQIQIQRLIKTGTSRSYADFILDPQKNYIFRIFIQSNSNTNTFILIGLLNELFKDQKQVFRSGLAYLERGDDRVGIQKILKGDNVFEGKKQNINKEIEVRINLQNKILKVANYPFYENVVELEDKTRIKENQQYRFATELHELEHIITITYFEIVDEYDDKM